jgi:hypothetical protein
MPYFSHSVDIGSGMFRTRGLCSGNDGPKRRLLSSRQIKAEIHPSLVASDNEALHLSRLPIKVNHSLDRNHQKSIVLPRLNFECILSDTRRRPLFRSSTSVAQAHFKSAADKQTGT